MKYPLFVLFCMAMACCNSQKIYQAPAMGAEAQFDKGLRPEKHPKYLFDRQMMKNSYKRGAVSTAIKHRHRRASPYLIPGKNGSGADSSRQRRVTADSMHIFH